MLRKNTVIGILMTILILMLITGCSGIAPNISSELEKGKPDSLPEQALEHQQATAHVPEQAQVELPFEEEGGGAVPISIVLSWGTYDGSTPGEFQARLIPPVGDYIAFPGVGENQTVTIQVDTFDPGTYYYYVAKTSPVKFKDVSFFKVEVFDNIANSLLATFSLSDATGEEAFNSVWRVFTFDGDTGEITPINEFNSVYAPPW